MNLAFAWPLFVTNSHTEFCENRAKGLAAATGSHRDRETDRQTDGRTDGSGLRIRRFLLSTGQLMRNTCAKIVSFSIDAEVLNFRHLTCSVFLSLRTTKLTLKSDQDKEGNRQLLGPIILRTVWQNYFDPRYSLTGGSLVVKWDSESRQITKKDGEDIIDDTMRGNWVEGKWLKLWPEVRWRRWRSL
jgi:hypothetical protein